MEWITKRDLALLESNTNEKVEIDLSNMGLFDENIEQIVLILAKYPRKEISLNLFGNNIRCKGAIFLSKLNNIYHIILTYNNIKNDGLIALVHNPSFKYIEMDDCVITDACLDIILQHYKGYDLRIYKNRNVSDDTIDKINQLTRHNYDIAYNNYDIAHNKPSQEKKEFDLL